MDTEQAKTSGECLADQTALVRFAFQWLATHPLKSYVVADEANFKDAIQGYAKQIAADPHYIGEVVGMFIVNPRQCEPGGVNAATWGQS